jgi:hypothetical protein
MWECEKDNVDTRKSADVEWLKVPVSSGKMGVHGTKGLTRSRVRNERLEDEPRMSIQDPDELPTGVPRCSNDCSSCGHGRSIRICGI